MEYEFTAATFTQEVLKAQGLVLVDFYATWCPPCKMMGPVIQELAEEYAGKVKIGRIDSDKVPDLLQEYHVLSIPTFLFFRAGKVVDEAAGAMPKEMLQEKLDALL